MKKLSLALLRVLGVLLDIVIVSIPIQVIMVGVFQLPDSQANFFFTLLFAMYGTLFIEYLDGRTLGKYLAKIKVISKDGTKPVLLYVGLRELTKSLYLVPFFGWGAALISLCMIAFGKGRGLHDIVGNTQVIYIWDEEKLDEEA